MPKIDLSLPKKQHCTVSHKSSIKHKHSVSRLGRGEERAAGPNGCHTCRVRAEAEGGYWVLTSYTWYSGHSWGCHCHLQFNPCTPRSRSLFIFQTRLHEWECMSGNAICLGSPSPKQTVRKAAEPGQAQLFPQSTRAPQKT